VLSAERWALSVHTCYCHVSIFELCYVCVHVWHFHLKQTFKFILCSISFHPSLFLLYLSPFRVPMAMLARKRCLKNWVLSTFRIPSRPSSRLASLQGPERCLNSFFDLEVRMSTHLFLLFLMARGVRGVEVDGLWNAWIITRGYSTFAFILFSSATCGSASCPRSFNIQVGNVPWSR